MPIEFSCGQCQRTLRVPDDSAGREARCPQCGTISTVPSPAATAAEFDQPAGPPPAQPTQANPYASPHIQTPETTETARSTPTIIAPTIIDIGDVFSRSWQLFKDQMGLCISALLVYMAVQMGISFVNGIIGQLAAMTQGWAAAVVIQFILQVGIWLLNIWFSAGLALFALNVARGPGDLSDVFRGGPFFGRLVLANILVSLIVLGIMLVCCGLPAIIGAVVGQGMNGAVVGSVVGIAIAVKVSDRQRSTIRGGSLIRRGRAEGAAADGSVDNRFDDRGSEGRFETRISLVARISGQARCGNQV